MMGATHKETFKVPIKTYIMKRNKQTITSQTKPQTLQILQIITKVNITCHGKWFAGSSKWFAGSSLEIRLSKNGITGKIAYQSPLQTP